MVITRSSAANTDTAETPLEGDPLIAIASKLNMLDELRDKVHALELSQQKRGKKVQHWANNTDDETDAYRPRPPYAKIDFPKFSGGDPRGWILKAEKYFRYYNTPEDDKVEIAAMYLEEDALDLFSWMNHERTLLYWDELVKILEEHYGPPEYLNPDEHLCAIKQTGTVHDYRQEWARRVARVKNWPDHCLLGVFINGLKEELRSEVRIHKPRTVYRASSLALEFEKKAQIPRGPRPNHSYTQNRWTPPQPHPPARDIRDSRTTDLLASSSYSTRPSSSASITPKYPITAAKSSLKDAERQIRRDKGLCFRCGAPFRPGHRCNASFSLLEIPEEGDEVSPPINDDAEPEKESEIAEISFNAILGQNSAATMKLQGILKGRSVLILVDSGSTHNFISESVVAELQLPVRNIPTLGVQIGNGSRVRCHQVCPDVEVKISDLNVQQDFYPFSLGGCDLVLGIKWLASLNTVQANWNKMFMIFWLNGKKYKLQGLTANSDASVRLQSMLLT